jgi:hypothetical protein
MDVPIQRVLPCDFRTFTFLAFNEKLFDFKICGKFSPWVFAARGLLNALPVAGSKVIKIER